MKSILLVDDEPVVSSGLQRTFRHFGFAVEVARTTDEAHACLEEGHFDLILVDFDLRPGSTSPEQGCVTGGYGTGLVRELRAAKVSIPILMYTVLEGEIYETASLDAGADDYILKRTPMSTLLSRLHAHLRRHERDTGRAPSTTRRLGLGRFTLDREAHVLAAGDTPIPLTTKETQILEILGTNPSRVVAPEELLNRVWGNDFKKSPSALSSVLKRLRQKLKEHDIPDIIENVNGRGFKLSPRTAEHTSSS